MFDEKKLKEIGAALMEPIREALAKKHMKDEIDRILPPCVLRFEEKDGNLVQIEGEAE